MNESKPRQIKICGLGDPYAAQVAVESGATALGFMLAESRRKARPDAISAILEELPVSRPPAVGVFVNEPAENIAAVVSAIGLDMVQLSGDEAPEILENSSVPGWKALRFTMGTTFDAACQLIEPWLTHHNPVAAVLIDAAVVGRYGGSGQRADWDLAARLAERYPVILAGGLDADNVADAIRTVRPIGVDVSSGVEVDGIKDHASIRNFIAASQQGFANLV
ncbi:phosphoribosylanthranilate isomerase [soil metagenome]